MAKLTPQDFIEKWPSAIVCRTEVDRATGGLLTPKHMANLDSEGAGPPEVLRMGSERKYKVAYPAASFFEWVCGQLQPIERKQKKSSTRFDVDS